MNRLKRAVVGMGLTGALAAGAVAFTAGTASAANNYFIRTYYATSWDGAQSACQTDANRHNSGDSAGFYYCSPGPTQYQNGQYLYGYNLWERL